VAQEVEEAAKKINYEFSGVDAPKSKDGIYGLRYAEFIVPLVKSVQELGKKNQELEERIAKLEEIIPAGNIYVLSHALNLSRGGRLVSLEHEKTEGLLNVFDELSNYTKHFYYGRYDIKCKSIEDLKNGKNFTILEYNGCGAEPHHIYGNGNTLLQAYKIVLHHWSVLYRISKYNHERGFRYWELKRGMVFLKNAKRHFKILKEKDRSFPAS
jgi:hypothetical protein